MIEVGVEEHQAHSFSVSLLETILGKMNPRFPKVVIMAPIYSGSIVAASHYRNINVCIADECNARQEACEGLDSIPRLAYRL